MRRGLLATLLVATLLLPAQAAAYNGLVLSRGTVGEVELVDQHGDNVSLDGLSDELLVVTFVFTHCPDVCPVITHTLKAVQAGLSEELADDVGFVSITVDPVRDTPERLLTYTEYHDVNWPHLTADNVTLEDVWARFGVDVQSEVIEAHGGAPDFAIEAATVTVVTEEGKATEHLVQPTGWNMTVEHADAAGWNLSVSSGADGRTLDAVDGVTAPLDGSWRWELQRWNTTVEGWEKSPVGIDDVNGLEHPHLAWVASSRNASEVPSPTGRSSMHVLFPNGNLSSHMLETTSAHLMTLGAMNEAGMDVDVGFEATTGHVVNAINGTRAPTDASWAWRLAVWNGSLWETTTTGMDGLHDAMHIAWSSSSVNLSDIPAPGSMDRDGHGGGSSTECNGHGWIMGSGSAAHCMCDEGHGWDGDDRLSCISDDGSVSVGHQTVTFILDAQRRPRVMWSGDGWKPDAFTEDLVELAQDEGVIPRPEQNSPSPGVALSIVAMLGAAMILERRRS